MENVKIIDGKKFMWDGQTYDSKVKAQEVISNYEKDKFETRLIKEEDKYFVYTRRVVTEVVVEGPPPDEQGG